MAERSRLMELSLNFIQMKPCETRSEDRWPQTRPAISVSEKLDAGTYYLKETKSPEGYTLLADAIKVEIIDPDGTGNYTLKVNDKEVDTTTGSFVTRLEQASGTAVVAGREPQRLQPSRDRRGRYRSVPDHRRGRYCDGFCCSCKKDEKRELIIYETQEIMHYHPVFYPVFVFPGCHGLSFCDAAL